MVLNVIQRFKDRVKEVDLYFEFLKLTQFDNAVIGIMKSKCECEHILNNDIKTLLRANAFLILYNLIESTVKEGIEAIYNSIINDSLCYSKVRSEIRNIWVQSWYSGYASSRAGHEKYLAKTIELIEAAVSNTIIKMNPNYDGGISGSLDAQLIREIAGNYGFSSRTRKESCGGNKLVTVKLARNDLAHGNLSFVECGRDYPFDELDRMRIQVKSYLEDILNNIKAYIDAQDYTCRHVS